MLVRSSVLLAQKRCVTAFHPRLFSQYPPVEKEKEVQTVEEAYAEAQRTGECFHKE